eukprot:scaffold584898_cov18-Prasinocladus_malaysianus.AAC.1
MPTYTGRSRGDAMTWLTTRSCCVRASRFKVQSRNGVCEEYRKCPPDAFQCYCVYHSLRNRSMLRCKCHIDHHNGRNSLARESWRSGAGHIPESFFCMITGEVFTDPVMARDGHTYERSAIEAWLGQCGASPITRGPMDAGCLLPNRSLLAAIEELKSKREGMVADNQQGCNYTMNSSDTLIIPFSELYLKTGVSNAKEHQCRGLATKGSWRGRDVVVHCLGSHVEAKMGEEKPNKLIGCHPNFVNLHGVTIDQEGVEHVA